MSSLLHRISDDSSWQVCFSLQVETIKRLQAPVKSLQLVLKSLQLVLFS